MPRSFVALALDDATRATIAAGLDRLRPLSRAVAWVPAANLHITLKFLGDQPDERLAEVGPALAEAAATLPPFALALSGIGGFPGMERPRILWVGVADGALAARGLQERVEAALEHRGFARDTRPWHPHVTIGRVLDDRRWRREDSAPLRRAVAAAAREPFGLLPVNRVALMRSDLTPSGARYNEIGSAALGAAS